MSSESQIECLSHTSFPVTQLNDANTGNANTGQMEGVCRSQGSRDLADQVMRIMGYLEMQEERHLEESPTSMPLMFKAHRGVGYWGLAAD